jgi:hypothetical protein
MSELSEKVLATLAVILGGAVIGLVIALVIATSNTAGQANSKADSALVKATSAALSAQSAALSAQIARSQADTVAQIQHADCVDRNKRHAEAVYVLAGIYDHVPVEPRTAYQRAQLKASRKATLALLDAILPQRRC